MESLLTGNDKIKKREWKKEGQDDRRGKIIFQQLGVGCGEGGEVAGIKGRCGEAKKIKRERKEMSNKRDEKRKQAERKFTKILWWLFRLSLSTSTSEERPLLSLCSLLIYCLNIQPYCSIHIFILFFLVCKSLNWSELILIFAGYCINKQLKTDTNVPKHLF